MASTLQTLDIGDIVKTSLYDLGPLKFQQIAQGIQHYEVFSKWFRKDKVTFGSGIGIQRTLMSRYDETAARHVGHLEADQVNIPDVLDQLQVPWRHVQTQWAIIFQTDVLMNSGRSLVLNVIEPKRASALIGLVTELENRAWGDAPSATDVVLPWGIQYWLTENATTGFNGGVPSGHTTIGGVNLSNTPNFKNYTAVYVDVTKPDLIKKMRTGHRNIHFVSPVRIQDYRGEIGDRYRVYVNESVMSDIEDSGEGQNENLGRDIATMDGSMVFRRNPILWIPQLDSRSDNPVYLVDHSTFYPVCLQGDYLRESDADKAPNQHNVYQVFIDLTYNYVCIDRRRNAVFTTSV